MATLLEAGRVEPTRTVGKGWDLPTGVLLAAAGVLLLAVGASPLRGWLDAYTQPDSYYAYGPVVPALTALMLWHRRAVLGAVAKVPCFAALAGLLPSLALLVLATKKDLASVASLALLLSFWSMAWLLLGTAWVRAAAFPLGFLVWMAPLPGPLLHDGTFGAQQLSTVLADKALHGLGFSTALSGNVITMDNFLLFIDVPCSGMKLLLTMLMLGAALAWLADGPGPRRVALFGFVVPLAVAVNVLRILVLGVVGECFGARAEHGIHDGSGLMVVAVGLATLIWVARRIGCRTFAGWPLF